MSIVFCFHESFFVTILEVIGFLKNAISETTLANDVKVNQGCLTDCVQYKLEIRMPNLVDMSHIVRGSHVRVTGTVKCGNHPYLHVLKASDVVQHSEEKRSLLEMFRGSSVLPKENLKDCSPSVRLLIMRC